MTAAGRWSDHRCLGAPDAGLDIGGVDFGGSQTRRLHRNQKERTCIFHNVCYDGALVDSKPAGWTYFAHPDEFVGLDAFAAGVDVWARGDFGGNGNRSVDHTFRVRHASVPAHAEYLQTPTIIKVAPLAPANFGHFLGNALYPAFVAAWRLFGACRIHAAPGAFRRRQPDRYPGDGAPLRALAGRGRRARRRWRDPLRTAHRARREIRFAAAAGRQRRTPIVGRRATASRRAQRSSKLLCAEALVVGTGDLGFSTKYRLDGGAGRHPPQLLWSDFVEHASARLLAPRLPPSSRRPPLGAALVMKLGRRAPSAGAYASLRASIEATLGLEVNLVEPHKLSVRQQLEEMSRAAVAVSPDGGASFACAFLADGAAVVILGYLERWIWANDRRVRAFYCAPRDDHLPCAPAIGSPSEGATAARGRSCYSVRSLQPCLDTMLRRALAYARLTWPALPPPPRGRGTSEGKSVKHGREGIPSRRTAVGPHHFLSSAQLSFFLSRDPSPTFAKVSRNFLLSTPFRRRSYPTKPRRERWYTRAAKNRALEPVWAEWQERPMLGTSSSTTPRIRGTIVVVEHDRALDVVHQRRQLLLAEATSAEEADFRNFREISSARPDFFINFRESLMWA